MRTRILLGIAVLLGALLVALNYGWSPRTGLNWPIGRDSVTPSSIVKSVPADRALPSPASVNAPDFASRARAALAMPLDRPRGDALQAIIAEWMATDPLACFAFLEGAAANDPMRASLSDFAIERWLGRDEPRAREWVLTRIRADDALAGFYLRPVLALEMKRGGLSALIALFRELPATDSTYMQFVHVGSYDLVLKPDRASATAFINEVPESRGRDGLWQMFGVGLVRQRGPSILNQIGSDGLLEGLPAAVTQGMVSSLIDSDLTGTGRWLSAQPRASIWDGPRARQSFAEAELSPELALQTAALITDEKLQDLPNRHALSRWAAKDYAAAAEWAAASSLPAELVAEALVRGQVIRDPAHYERALNAAAARAHDEKTRVRGQFVILQSWLAADRAAARGWIAASNLPADAKQALLGVNP